MRAVSYADVIVLDDSSDDDSQGPSAPVAAPSPPPPARRALTGAMDSSTRGRAGSLSDEDEDDGFEILTPLPTPGRSLEDSLSFSELQAQQIAFAQLHREANRKKARGPAAAVGKPKAAAKGRPTQRGRSPARVSPSPSPSPSLSSASSSSSSPRSESRVMKKSALSSPFEDAPRRSEASAFRARATRERRAPPSFSELQAQEQVYKQLKSQWKKAAATADDSSIPTGYPQQNLAGLKPESAPARGRSTASSSTQRPSAKSSEQSGSETDVLEYDDDFVTENTSDDDDFFAPEYKKPKTNSSTDKLTAPSRDPPAKAKNGKKANGKKKHGKSGGKAAAKGNGGGSSAPTPPVELVSDTLSHPRDATSTVIHGSSWRGVYFDDAPLSVLPLDEIVDAEFCFESERPLTTFDATGALEEKAKLISSFGQAKQLVAAAQDGGAEPAKTQEEMDQLIQEAVDEELPLLKALYTEKARAIMSEARSKTAKYLDALNQHRRQRFAIPTKQLDIDPTESKLIPQMKHPVRLRRTQTSRMKFAMGNGETNENETFARPQDVFRLAKLRPLSKATAYVGVKANVRVEDDPIMHYVPYFGDQDDGAVIDVNNYDGIKTRDGKQRSGLDDEVDEYLLRVIVRRFGDSDRVFSALKTVVGFAQGYSDYGELKKTLEARRLATRRIGEAKQLLGCGVSKLPELTPLLQDAGAARSALMDRFAVPPSFFESNTARNFSAREHGLGLRSTSDYRELCVTYRDLFCRMCYCYDCPEHGIEHPAPTHRIDPVNPEVRLAPVVLARAEQESAGEGTPVDETPIYIADSPETKDQGVDQGAGQGTDLGAQYGEDGDDETKQDVPMTSEEITEILTVEDRRRSSRSLTRISSRASASLKLQTALVETTKPVRAVKSKPVKTMVDESEYLDDSYYQMVSSIVKQSQTSDAKCSDACWKQRKASEGSNDGEAPAPSASTESARAAFTPTELLLIDKLRYIIGDNACMIASIVRSTLCRDIYAFLASEKQSKPRHTESMDAAILSPVAQSKSGRKRGRSVPGSNNRELLKRTRYQRMKDIGANHEYEPCNHEGSCDSKVCSCMTRDHTCDKACSCSRDCSNRFQGCRCSYGNCRTKACPCFVAMRECNPDMCVMCGASEAPVLVFSDSLKSKTALELGICCNVNILRGLHKKIGVAFSTTHGWGAFAREPIKRGEFIYEYHGALLSQDEAERRGSIYDKMTISFLFDANEDSVVDAIRKGNKSKFANHASVGQKCQARVMRVGGEHRISIWAKQDIEKGEELFFDYGYHGESAPDWSQLRIKGASARHAKDDNSDDE